MSAEHALPPAVTAWRAFHTLITAGFLASIAYIWRCAINGRRGPLLRTVVGALLVEGALVTANHGDCPLGPLGDRIGDQVPLFELVLPPRAARLAVPFFGAVAAGGIVLLAARSPFRGSLSGPQSHNLRSAPIAQLDRATPS